MKTVLLFLFILQIPARVFGSEFVLPEYQSLGGGAWYGRVQVKSPPIIYHVIKCDQKGENLTLKPIRPRRDETLGELAGRLKSEGLSLLGAITGDYFNYVREYELVLPWGILAQEGTLIFSPEGKSAFCSGTGGAFVSIPEMRAWLGNRPGGPRIPIISVNRPIELEGNEVGIFNSTWGDFAPENPKGFAVTVSGEGDFRLGQPLKGMVSGISRLPVKVPIPEKGFVLLIKDLPSAERLDLELGVEVRVEIELSPTLESAIGGGPRIIRGGKVSVELDRENFGSGYAFYIKSSRHPRSAVGIGPEGGDIYLVAVEGRSDQSRGASLEELARLLLSLGAAEAMAFDGGRSVSMYVDGREVVEGDRRMADALGVFRVQP